MRYFTFAELSRSYEAKKRGIDNSPSEEAKKNLQMLVDKLLDPLRERYGKPIIVNSGYRCLELNKAIGGAKNSNHCFDDQTEILTSSGWKTHDTIHEEDAVLSYNLETGTIEEKPIIRIIKRDFCGELYHASNANVDVMATDEHRILIRYAAHKYKRVENPKRKLNITQEGQKHFDSLKTDNDKWHFELFNDIYEKRRIFMCASNRNGVLEVDMDMMRLALAVVADGYWCNKQKYPDIGFRFKKERKINELEALLRRMGVHYTKHIQKGGVTHFYINTRLGRKVLDIIGYNKEIPYWILQLHGEKISELLKYYAFWDGCFDKREGCDNFSICTTSKHNMDILTAMAPLCGCKCSVNVLEEREYNIQGKSGIAKRAYCISYSEGTESRMGESYYERVPYNGIVWCVENENSTVIIRRNGKVSVQGNCKGMAADITTGTKEGNKRLFNLVKDNFDFDECIDEKDYSWIHVAYRGEGKNRKKVLHL